MKRIFYFASLFVVVLISANSALAVSAFNIEKIEVEGLQRISTGTVFNYLPIKIGDEYSDEKSKQIISVLYETGFFHDVRLSRDGNVLLIKVEERPSIADITLSGNDEIETKDLLDGLEKSGLSKGRILDRSLLDRIELDLQRQYFILGHYAVEVDAEVEEESDNRVNIKLDIREGQVARIKQINIIGNKEFDEETLLDEFELGIPAFYAIFSDSDQYSKQKLSADLETLRSFYLDRGYVNFNVRSTQVSITPDKSDVFIAINVHEGEQFTVREIAIAGDLIVDEWELRELLTVEKDAIFSRRKITQTSNALTERLGNEGYAFANVNAVPELDNESREVTLTFFIDPGKRVYVRRVNVSGNDKTEDEVIRREFRQMEGAWLSTGKLERSRVRVQRLKYLDQITVETPLVPGTTDQVDVNMSVNERPSGSLMLGMGYSDGDGMLFNASVSQDNFFGTGKRISTEVNTSKANTVYSFSNTNPYYTLDGVSRSMRAYFRETDAGEANLADYLSDVWGVSVSYGFPLSEFNTGRVGLGYEDTRIKTTSVTPVSYTDYLAVNSEDFDTLKLSLGWTHDTRNRTIFATEGMIQSLSTDIALPSSGIHYYKITSRSQWLYSLTKMLTVSLKAGLNFGDSYKDTTDLPFFEKFYAGGSSSVRGYRANSLGPIVNNVNLGGNFRVVGNAELLFPPPFSPESNTVRMSLFWDAGNVFVDTDDYDTSELRQSAGMSLLWMSPIGPLSFSLSETLNEKLEDRTEKFQFTLGTFY